MLCGSREVMKAAEEHLGTTVGHTTDDGLFTLVEVSLHPYCPLLTFLGRMSRCLRQRPNDPGQQRMGLRRFG